MRNKYSSENNYFQLIRIIGDRVHRRVSHLFMFNHQTEMSRTIQLFSLKEIPFYISPSVFGFPFIFGQEFHRSKNCFVFNADFCYFENQTWLFLALKNSFANHRRNGVYYNIVCYYYWIRNTWHAGITSHPVGETNYTNGLSPIRDVRSFYSWNKLCPPDEHTRNEK